MDDFQGSSKLKLDAKGRLTVPAKYRQYLFPDGETRATLTLNLHEPCLVLYPMTAWLALKASLNQMGGGDDTAAMAKRRVIGHAETIILDGSGRMPIAPLLRDKAALTKEVTMIGGGHCYEIWDIASYEAHEGKMFDRLNDKEVKARMREAFKDIKF